MTSTTPIRSAQHSYATGGFPRWPPSRKPILSRWIARAIVAVATVGGVAAAAATERPAGVDCAAPAVTPTETITLYDGRTVKDLRHFYTWLAAHAYDDPNGVFGVAADVDGAPAMRVSGQDWGGIITRKNYRDYRLVLEYRWSDKTWSGKARNSGVLFHCHGEDGNQQKSFKGPWQSSVEYEIQEGRTGAVILVPGFRLDGTRMQPTIMMRTTHDRISDPNGEPQAFAGGFLFQSTYDVGWKNEKGFRGTADADKPLGEWNHVGIIAKGGDIAYFLNGTKILEATDGSYSEGRIMLQSEGAEILFRRIELHPLTER